MLSSNQATRYAAGRWSQPQYVGAPLRRALQHRLEARRRLLPAEARRDERLAVPGQPRAQGLISYELLESPRERLHVAARGYQRRFAVDRVVAASAVVV